MKTVSTLIVLLVYSTFIQFALASIKKLGWDAEHFQLKSVSTITPNNSRKSVVENWQSVCKEVCSVGFGGPGCGPQCVATKTNSSPILNNIFIELCPILCINGLGFAKCSCPPTTYFNYHFNLQRNRNLFCDVVCSSSNHTLAGCTSCVFQHDLIIATSLQKSISTTGATVPIDKEDTTPSISTETTPNWSELCNSLCKTGDGGALCDCDIPPFF